MPSVCICVPAYNSETTIRETLESLLNQTYARFKIIVIDNFSTDGTCDVVKEMAALDPRISLVENTENIGAEGNFNRCIQLAEGDFTGIFHADDLYESTILAKQVAFLGDHPEAAAVFARACTIDELGVVNGLDSLPPELSGDSGWTAAYGFEQIFKLVLRDSNFFICPSALVRTDVLKEHVRVWDGSTFRSSADLGVWLKILERFKVGILPEPLIRYRQTQAQGTATLLHLDTQRADFFLVIDHYLKALPRGVDLGKKDLVGLRFLRFRDDCRRAANCIITGKYAEARTLTAGVMSLSILLTALRAKPRRLMNHSRLFFFIYGVLLFLMARAPQLSFFRRMLYSLKYQDSLTAIPVNDSNGCV